MLTPQAHAVPLQFGRNRHAYFGPLHLSSSQFQLVFFALWLLVMNQIPVSLASEIGDRCSKQNPCRPSDNDDSLLFCDFVIGPGPGGYCVVCDGKEVESDCQRTGLSSLGQADCIDKCFETEVAGFGLLPDEPPVVVVGVGDCSLDTPCVPSESENYFCDFSLGPESGGFCIACGERSLDGNCGDETGISDMGVEDCFKKCYCDESCSDGQFCSYENSFEGPCLTCDSTVVHPDECSLMLFTTQKGVEACQATCSGKTCSKESDCISHGSSLTFFCNFNDNMEEEPLGFCESCQGMTSIDECSNRSNSNLGVQECENICAEAVVQSCSSNADCTHQRTFCNVEAGYCEDCPSEDFQYDWHVDQCFDVGVMGLSEVSSSNCAIACQKECWDLMYGSISIEGTEAISEEENLPLHGTPHTSGAGPLVDCKFGAVGECEPAYDEDFVCLVSRGYNYFSEKVVNCAESGGVAAIIYDHQEDNSIFEGSLFGVSVDIPATIISLKDGVELQENELGKETEVSIVKTGEDCYIGCSERITCASFPDTYCDYSFGWERGYCQECLADKSQQYYECFFSGLHVDGAKGCADTCEPTSPNCRICGNSVTASTLTSAEDKNEAQCNFCPNELEKAYFDQEIPFIGENITCFQLYQFFLNYQVSENDEFCELALNFNYLCNCEGPGYAGASTQQKQNALVWVPRVSGILSFVGSSFIIVSVIRDRKKLKKQLYRQLMLGMSIFDLMGSAAYSFTSLPIPVEYGIYGSKGNDASCTAQGFFIQMGTTAAFINVSLAVYYYLVIKMSWSENKILKNRIWFFLCPITVGLVFAFVGIPFYDMLFLWCNNSAPYWPDVPIILSILFTTCVMISVCWFVYKTEKASRRYAGGAGQRSMASTVFWQSIWYLLSFYLTWPPYLALQYLWASGRNYSSYGFILFASTLVPLQGFWNCVVFFRGRIKKRVKTILSELPSNLPHIKKTHLSSTKQSESKDASNTLEVVAIDAPVNSSGENNKKDNEIKVARV